jgi:hypothetical protein
LVGGGLRGCCLLLLSGSRVSFYLLRGDVG